MYIRCRPCREAGSNRDVPVVDRFDLLPQSLKAVPRLTRWWWTLCASCGCTSFVDASTSLRGPVPKHYSFLGSDETLKIQGNMINDDLHLRVGELTRTVKADYSAATPPEAEAVFVIPLCRDSQHSENLCAAEAPCTSFC